MKLLIIMSEEIEPNPSSKKRLWVVATVVVVVVIIIVASYAYVSTRSTNTTKPTLTQAQETLSATWANVPNIDPAIGSDEASSAALLNLYDTLIFPTASGAVVPDLATSWSVSGNGLVYTFQVRSNVTFHNGDILNASDVAFSMDRLLTMGQGYSYLFSPYVEKTTAPNSSTVVFTLKTPFAPFLSSLVRLYVLDQKQVMSNLGTGSYGTYGDYGSTWLLTHDAGSGPYEVIYANLETNITIEEYPNYWNGTMPNQPKYMDFIGTTQTSTVQALFSSKAIQITDMWQEYSTVTSLATQPGAKMATYLSSEEMYLMINSQKAPTNDVYVREAMAYALNYSAIVNQAFPGNTVSAGPIPKVLPGHDNSIPTSTQNLTMAKALIKESKYYGNLSKYPITYYWVTQVPAEQKMALEFASDMSAIGLTVNVEGVPWLSVVADLANESSSPNIVSIENAASYFEAGSILQEMFTTAAVGTWEQNFWLNNTTISDAISTAVTIQNQTDRFQAYSNIQQMIYNQFIGIYPFDVTEVRAYYPSIVDWYAANGQTIGLLGYDWVLRDITFNATAMPS
jgi:peptide/nickel transport system substrate-binding protein